MKNFVKLQSELVNGNVVLNEKPMGRSLVLVNAKTGIAYNVAAKCRNTDKVSICKALAKAYLAAKLAKEAQNSTEAAVKSGKKASDNVSSAFGCHRVYVTDKDGNLLEESCVMVNTGTDGELVPLRNVFRFTKSQEIYKLVVEQGKDWSDANVVEALKWWCTAAVEQLDYLKRLDEAIGKAADSNEKEAKAAEKAAKAETEAKAA